MWFISCHTPFCASSQVTMIWHWTEDYGSMTKLQPAFHSSFLTVKPQQKATTLWALEKVMYTQEDPKCLGFFFSFLSVVKNIYLWFLTFRTGSSVSFRYRSSSQIADKHLKVNLLESLLISNYQQKGLWCSSIKTYQSIHSMTEIRDDLEVNKVGRTSVSHLVQCATQTRENLALFCGGQLVQIWSNSKTEDPSLPSHVSNNTKQNFIYLFDLKCTCKLILANDWIGRNAHFSCNI